MADAILCAEDVRADPDFTVYGLYDNRDGVVRYVGQTQTPLWQRLGNHMAKASPTDPRPVLRWIHDVFSAGSVVQIRILKLNAVKNKDESKIINDLIASGHQLLNIEHCGSKRSELSKEKMTDEVKKKIIAGVTASMTSEVRARISAGLKGMPKSRAHRLAISLATKGRNNKGKKDATGS